MNITGKWVGHVLVVRLEGVFTLASDGELREYLRAKLRGGAHATAILMDYRALLVLLSASDWLTLAEHMMVANWSHTVTAHVCSPQHLANSELFCERAATAGLMHLAFTDFDEALAWAGRRAGARLPSQPSRPVFQWVPPTARAYRLPAPALPGSTPSPESADQNS